MIYKNITIEWLGHSGFRIKTKNSVIYIDPFQLREDYVSEDNMADFIFITHSHQDHCSIEDIQKITRDGTRIICTADCQSKFRHVFAKVEIINADSSSKLEFKDYEIRVWCVPAYNLNKRFHTREEDWVGYIIQIGEDSEKILIYHAGDSDLIPEMKNIKDIDVAILPIGGNFTMNAGEAAKAASIIQPKIAVPMHYASIPNVSGKEEAEIFVRLCSGSDVVAKVLERV